VARTYTLSMAASITHVPAHPERTAIRNAIGTLSFDIIYREWPSRGAMLTTLDMQGKHEPHPGDWRDWMKTPMAKKLLPA
jgi:hypothetical protein